MPPILSAAVLCSLILGFLSPENTTPADSIYRAFRSHGLPVGLLPKGVTDFSIDGEGRFEAHLDQECNAKFESELRYERNVSGRLSYGQIGELSGVSAQELFMWFPVKGIRVDIPSSGLIYFDVGVVFKQFSLSSFDAPPECTAVGGGSGEFVAGDVLKVQSGKVRARLETGDPPINVLRRALPEKAAQSAKWVLQSPL